MFWFQITFSSDDEGTSALDANGQELSGRKLKVNTAKENNRCSGGGNGGGHRDY